jgi:hypothetical protein
MGKMGWQIVINIFKNVEMKSYPSDYVSTTSEKPVYEKLTT